MPDNLTYKILRAHLVEGTLSIGDDIRLRPAQVLIEDATGTMTAMQFELLNVDAVDVPLAVLYVDHNVLQIDDKNMQDHRYLKSFCARYGLHYSPAGHGISHYVHLERFSRPGELLLGADSHTSTAGAAGMFAVGAGGLEVAVAMAGHGVEMRCPRVVGVELRGSLREAVEPKDVVLEILRRYGVRGGRGAVFEFFGPGVATLSVTGRATIANMIVETGATTAVFPSDHRTLEWFAQQHRSDVFRPLQADPGASYDEYVSIDLAGVVPMVAVPFSPDNVVDVSSLPDTPVSQVCVGSSVNSSYEDLATVAAALRGRQVHPDVQLTVTPGSRQILDTLIGSGVYQDLMQAGARMLEPICGPCVGIGQAPLQRAASLRTFNRNFPGRSGTAEDRVYLCSPSTAAASALAGRITDPTGRPRVRPRPPVLSDPRVHARQIVAPPAPAERAAVAIERGPNLVPPPQFPPPPTTLSARVLAVVGDDISTGDMAPDGVIAMSVWSNLAACAPFMFSRIDPGFHDRALDWGGGIIVAGDNYGQGSSREHAALIPGFLGVRAVAARSYARIHRRNLIAAGIVPLVLPADRIAQVGERWVLQGLGQALHDRTDELVVVIDDDIRILVRIELTASERAILAAGGLLAHTLSRTGVCQEPPIRLGRDGSANPRSR